jgi:mono/diheme cytochrome c family protein
VATRTSIRRGRLAALALALLAASGAAGCNKNSADVNSGKALFSARCSTCHQLADEGPGGGTQGPNLDDAFHAARLAGMDSDTVAGIVKAQVENPRPASQNPSDSMPPDLASGQDLDDIAAYVGAVPGRPGLRLSAADELLELSHPPGRPRLGDHRAEPRRRPARHERRRDQAVDRRPECEDHARLQRRDHAQHVWPDDLAERPRRAHQVPADMCEPERKVHERCRGEVGRRDEVGRRE